MEYYFTDKISRAQIENLVEMYKNEIWSRTRNITDVIFMLSNCEYIAVIDKSNEKVMAFARFLTDHIYRAFVYDVIVASEYRKQGFGKIVVGKLLEKLQTVERIELYCQGKNTAFYEKLGFKIIGEQLFFMRKTAGPQ